MREFYCNLTVHLDVDGVRRNPEVSHWVQVLRQRYSGMKLIVGRDKLDEVQVSVASTHPERAF